MHTVCPQGHPYDCFPVGSIYVYILVSHMQVHVCVVHVVKEVASFHWAWSINEWVWCVIERTLELYRPLRPARRMLLVAYVETGTTCNSYYT